MSDLLDDQDFYELMQAYRWSGKVDQSEVCARYEAVKDYIRANYVRVVRHVVNPAEYSPTDSIDSPQEKLE